MVFCAKEMKKSLIQWIRDWFEQNGYGCNAVIGISGGKDSSVLPMTIPQRRPDRWRAIRFLEMWRRLLMTILVRRFT